jgi:hypothetical protein
VSRRDLIARVVSGLPARSDSVAYPDHPLLLHGPDIVASIDSRLTAYFILERRVRQIPGSMLSNVLLSRLAFPRETTFVLILGDADAVIRASDSEIFEEVDQITNNQMATYPIGSMRRSSGAEAIEQLRTPHNERFGRAWRSRASRRDARSRGDRYPTSIARVGFNVARSRSRFLDFDNGRFILGQPNTERNMSARDLFDTATNAAVRVDYWLDLGVPGIGEVAQVMRSDSAYLALHESTIPLPTEVRRFDTLKPFRAAAFAGFAIESRLSGAI